MRLTITTVTDLVISLDVAGDMEIDNFKALCALETNLDAQKIEIYFNGNLLIDSSKTLDSYGVKDGDMLLIKNSVTNYQSMASNSIASSLRSQHQVSHTLAQDNQLEIANILATLRTNPEKLANLRVNNPRLADAYDKGTEEFCQVLRNQLKARAEEEQRRIRMMMADPFDSEAQHMIAEEIRRQQIDCNMESAMEYLPESFGEVTMLYIDCKVNKFPIKAFVDSGAQSTIMSKACAERCNILRLIDDRWSGIARGVGTQRILGKIHLVQIEINGVFLPCSFTILEHQPMDMLLGLDMLRRHQCCIDLKSNCLRIGTTDTETPFLSDREIPKFSSIDNDTQQAIQESLNLLNKSNDNRMASKSDSRSDSSSSSSSSASSTNSNHSEADIKEIMALGFKRDQVISELDTFNGDKNQAIASLFSKFIIVPDNL